MEQFFIRMLVGSMIMFTVSATLAFCCMEIESSYRAWRDNRHVKAVLAFIVIPLFLFGAYQVSSLLVIVK